MGSYKAAFRQLSVFHLTFTADSEAPSLNKFSRLPLCHGRTEVVGGQGWLTIGKCSDTHPGARQMAGFGSPRQDA